MITIKVKDSPQRTPVDQTKGGGYQIDENNYGFIRFGHIAREVKYIQLTSATDSEQIFKFLTTTWKLKWPRLLISISGDSKNYKMDPQLMRTFNMGLLSVVGNLSTWIISSVSTSGIMKRVRGALSGTGTTCIGISRWDDKIGKYEFLDESAEISKKQPAASPPAEGEICWNQICILENDDTGSDTGTDKGTHSKVRTHLESHLMKYSPGVLLILGGDRDTLEEIYAVATKDIRMPVILIKGSGRIADMFSDAVDGEMVNSKEERDRLLNKVIDELFPALATEERDETYRKIQVCLSVKNLFTVADIFESSLDDVLLEALLNDDNFGEKPYDLMQLALLLKRADFAENEILTKHKSLDTEEFNKMMIVALSMNSVSFVRLLLDYGYVSVEKLLDEEQVLEFLYSYQSHMKTSSFYEVYQSLKKKTRNDRSSDIISKYAEVCDVLSNYAGIDANDKYRFPMKDIKDFYNILSEEIFDDLNMGPFQQLFLWAVVNNMYEMALLFWKYVENAMANALIASRMCNTLCKLCPKGNLHGDLETLLKENRRKFKDKAIEVQDQCYKTNRCMTKILMVKPIKKLRHHRSCLDVAMKYDQKEFVAHKSLHALFAKVWREGDEVEPECHKHKSTNEYHSITTPRIKFFIHMVGYFGFLILFGFMLMKRKRDSTTIGSIEKALILIIIGYATGEIYQVIKATGYTLSEKLKDHIYDLWNIVDAVAITLFFLAVLLISNEATEHLGYVCYAMDYSIWILRLFQYLLLSRHCGKFIVMFFKMFMKTLPLLVIYHVWLIAYGVATAGILLPAGEKFETIFMHATFRSYFQSMGEFLMDKKSEKNFTRFGTPDMHMYDEPIALVYLGIYFLVTNIIILNILIARFLDIYQKVLRSSFQYWQERRIGIILEYCEKHVTLFPPFSLIQYVGYLFLWIFHKCKCESQPESTTRLGNYTADSDELRALESKSVQVVLHKEYKSIEEELLESEKESDLRLLQGVLQKIQDKLTSNGKQKENQY